MLGDWVEKPSIIEQSIYKTKNTINTKINITSGGNSMIPSITGLAGSWKISCHLDDASKYNTPLESEQN